MSIKPYPVFAAHAKRIFLSAFGITQFDPHEKSLFCVLNLPRAIINLGHVNRRIVFTYVSVMFMNGTLWAFIYASFLSVSMSYAPEARCPCTIGPFWGRGYYPSYRPDPSIPISPPLPEHVRCDSTAVPARPTECILLDTTREPASWFSRQVPGTRQTQSFEARSKWID